MMRWLKEMLLLNILLVPLMVFFPAICWLLAAHPDPTAAQACFWFGPLSAAFWMLVYTQLSSVPWRQGAEAVRQWRRDHGGLLVTVTKATCWMFFGLLGSFACEVLFMLAFRRYVPGGTLRLWLAVFPIACYAPLLAAWAWRRLHG